MSSSSVGINVYGDGAVLSSTVAASTSAAALAALTALRIRYTYPLEAYLNFCQGGVCYPRCPLEGKAEAAAEAESEAAAASA